MFLPETTSLCPGDNFFVPLAPQRQLGRFDVCQASQHLKQRQQQHPDLGRGDELIAPASLEALNALNSQNVDYIKYINSAGLHALNTLIQPAGIH